jgi:hypothetical protein
MCNDYSTVLLPGNLAPHATGCGRDCGRSRHLEPADGFVLRRGTRGARQTRIILKEIAVQKPRIVEKDGPDLGMSGGDRGIGAALLGNSGGRSTIFHAAAQIASIVNLTHGKTRRSGARLWTLRAPADRHCRPLPDKLGSGKVLERDGPGPRP